jgi:hypothetical protein
MTDGDIRRDEEPLDRDESSFGLVGYFRDRPARFFGVLGSITFVAGWAGVIYLAFFNDQIPGDATYVRIQILLSVGASVTIASAILWGIAAYVWIHLRAIPHRAS